MNTEINLILFDWSGTISDDRKVVHAANIMMCEYYRVKPVYDFSEWLKGTTRGLQEYFLDRGVNVSPIDIWTFYKKCFSSVLEQGLEPYMYEDVPDVLDTLRRQGKKLAVVSSHPQENLYKEAGSYRIAQYFDLIFGSVHNKVNGIIDVCKKLGTSKENTVYIGDMISDIIAAREAKVHSVAVSRGYHSKEMLRTQGDIKIWENLFPAKSKFIDIHKHL